MKKTMLLLLAIIFLSFPFCISVSADDVFDGGDGTIENPYIITTADQLNEVRYHLDKHFIQMQDIDLSAVTAEGGDYYDNGNGWLPIGDYSNSFTGTYNGNGHSINGMMINRTSTSSLYAGLFYSVTGTIKNLNLTNCNITAEASGTYGSVYCGAVSALMKEDSQIVNCTIEGNITTSSTYTSLVGGIIGSAQSGTADKIKVVKDCSVDLIMNVTAKSSEGHSTISTGGIIGASDIIEIYNCDVYGNIDVFPSKSNYVGGILGKIDYNALIMDWCSNNSQIQVAYGTNASNTSFYYVGGLIGRVNLDVVNPTGNSISIKNSFNSGDITSKINYAETNMVGGIIGHTSNAKESSSVNNIYKYDCSVENCYNVGDIAGVGSASYNEVGGIIGENDGFIIKNCYNSSSVSSNTTKSNTPNVGAISGYTTTDVLNSYWNISASQIVNGVSLIEDNKIGVGPSSRTDTAISMSPAKMKASSFVDNLNSYLPDQPYWKTDSDNVNNGYPILFKSQKDNSDEQIVLQATANAVNNHIVIFIKSSKEITDEMLHIALYANDGRMIDYLIVPTIEVFDKTNVVFKDDTNITKAKVFLWKGITSITPLTNTLEININR